MMGDELLEVYNRLNDFVPRNSAALIADTSASIGQLRRKTILSCRTICLQTYLSQPGNQLTCEQIRDIFDCRKQGTFSGVSQLSQNSAYVLTYLVDDPRLFAKTVVACANRNDFNTLIHIIVPSFFGFFSCDEQLSNAALFYREVCDLAKPPICVRILVPFFNSAATFRFVEHALDNFFRGFFLDLAVTPERDRDSLISVHAVNLLQCYSKAVPLLPSQYFLVLAKLREVHFPLHLFADLFLIRFLWPAAVNWLKASPRSEYCQFFDRVLERVSQLRTALLDFYHILFHSHSLNDAPRLFRDFGHHYVMYFLSVDNIGTMIHILGEQNALPPGLSLNDFADLDPKYSGHWFWCHVFPKGRPAVTNPRTNLIFHEEFDPAQIQTADQDMHSKLRTDVILLLGLMISFEHFLEDNWRFEELKRWSDVLLTQVNQFVVIHLQELKGDPLMPFSPEVQQILEVSAIGPDLIGKYSKQLLELGGHWERIIAKYRNGREFRKMLGDRHQAAQDWIWTGIRALVCIGSTSLGKGFPLLMKVILQFQTIAIELDLGVALLCNIIGQLPAGAILVPFVIVNATVVQHAAFMSNTETLAWLALESCIWFMLKDNPALLDRITAISGAIARDYSK